MTVKLSDAQRRVLLKLLGEAVVELDGNIPGAEMRSLKVVYRKVIEDGVARERRKEERWYPETDASRNPVIDWQPGEPVYPYGT